MKLRLLLGALALTAAFNANAVLLKITVTNVAQDSDFFLTPLWVGIHNGSFDLFDNNQAASAGLELLAEEGNPSTLGGEFADATGGNGVAGLITNPAGFPGAPVLDPGETGSITLQIDNPSENRFFSFASMVIPSNDAFIGNGRATAHRLFRNNGSFTNLGDIVVTGRHIYDAGTELDDQQGAAFSAIGGISSDENGTVRRRGLADLAAFFGTGTAAGTTINNIPGRFSQVARISFDLVSVPEPGSLALMGLGLLGLGARRRLRRS